LVEEEINVERIPVNKYVKSPPPAVRHEGNKTIISVLKEVVEKRLILVEEVHVTKHRTRRRKEEDIVLREEELHIHETDDKQ